MAAEEILGKAVLELTGNIAPLSKSLEAAKAEAEGMAKSTATGFKGGITKAAIPAAAAVTGLVYGLHKSIDAAEADQAAQAKLAAAFKAAGLNINNYKDSIDQTEKSSASLGFKSEDVKAALAQLVVATHNGKQATDLLGVAQNVARFKGIGLTDASKLLTTTMAGSARAAHMLGINIAPVTTATDALKAKTQYASLAAYEHAKATAYLSDKQATARKMTDLLNQKLGGQAVAFSKTAQGAKEKMGAEFQLLEINIGKVLLPVVTKLSDWLASFSQLLVKHAGIVKIVIGVLGALATAILLINAYLKIVRVTMLAFDAVMDANPITLIIVAIAALIVIFVELWRHSQTFRDIVLGVWADVKKAVKAFVDFFEGVGSDIAGIVDTITSTFQTVIDWFENNWPIIATLLSGPFAPIVGILTNAGGIRDKITGAFQDVINWFTNTFSTVEGYIEAPFNAAWSTISSWPQDVSKLFGKIKTWFSGAADWAFSNLIQKPFSDAWSWIKGLPGNIESGLGAIGGWFTKATNWGFTNLIKKPFEDAWSFIQGVPGDIVTVFGKLGSLLGKALKGLGKVLEAIFLAPVNFIIKAVNWLISGLDKIHFSIPGWVPGIGGKGFGIDIPQIPYVKLAEGGIVTSPTHALIGEAGPEAVIPLSGAGMGGGIVVNVSGVVGNEAAVAAKIGRELQKHMNRGLDFGLQGPVRLA